jgi:prepilin-type N-terminal cleavage/methylation domain-containing protein
MRRQGRTATHGFSLIEAAVAIGIIAILAAAAAPLVMKALNQQRESKTRESVKAAFESMFGSREHMSPNITSDYGYQPPAANGAQYTLQSLTTPALPVWGPNGALYYWGWNGPYWTGSIQAQAGTNGVPLDGWGRPIRMVLAGAGAARTVQFRSWGANGRDDGGLSDDISYPNSPILLSAQRTSNLYVTITNNRLVPLRGTLTVRWRDNGALQTTQFNLTTTATVGASTSATFGPASPAPYRLSAVVAGSTDIQWNILNEAAVTGPHPTPAYPVVTGTMVVTLLPSEAKQFPIVIN